MKIVCISDTHRQEKNLILPKGDMLICAGDIGIRDEFDLEVVIDWFKSLDFSHIIFCGGNHDLYLEQLFKAKIEPVMPKNIHYLCNTEVTIDGIKFWGSPYSPFFNNWAFMDFGQELKKIWFTIPEDTDIIITHCPSFGINDVVNGISQGCAFLRDRIKEIKPKYHICGHVHEGHGIYADEHTAYINASLMDEYYEMVNKPIVVEYDN